MWVPQVEHKQTPSEEFEVKVEVQQRSVLSRLLLITDLETF